MVAEEEKPITKKSNYSVKQNSAMDLTNKNFLPVLIKVLSFPLNLV